MSQAIAIMITGSPSSQSARSALAFAEAVISSGNQIYRLFFYHEGVLNASTLTVTSQDETNLPDNWQHFINANKLDAVVCIASGLRRGIITPSEADRHEKNAANCNKNMDLSGLGQWVEATCQADKYIVFGDRA